MHQDCSPQRAVAGFVVAMAISCGLLLAACGRDDSAADSWSLEGPLLAWEGDIWIVDGEPVVVPGLLNRDDQRRLGALVEARGTYDETGLRIANAIDVTGATEAAATLDPVELAGTIVAIDGPLWTVADTAVLVPDATWVTTADGSDATAVMAVDSFAEVRGHRVSDERVIALEIVLKGPAGEAEHAGDADAPREPVPVLWFPALPTGDDDNDGHDEKDTKGKSDKPGQDRDDSDDGNNGGGNDEDDDDD
jgi:hypothetical protein